MSFAVLLIEKLFYSFRPANRVCLTPLILSFSRRLSNKADPSSSSSSSSHILPPPFYVLSHIVGRCVHRGRKGDGVWVHVQASDFTLLWALSPFRLFLLYSSSSSSISALRQREPHQLLAWPSLKKKQVTVDRQKINYTVCMYVCAFTILVFLLKVKIKVSVYRTQMPL